MVVQPVERAGIPEVMAQYELQRRARIIATVQALGEDLLRYCPSLFQLRFRDGYTIRTLAHIYAPTYGEAVAMRAVQYAIAWALLTHTREEWSDGSTPAFADIKRGRLLWSSEELEELKRLYDEHGFHPFVLAHHLNKQRYRGTWARTSTAVRAQIYKQKWHKI